MRNPPPFKQAGCILALALLASIAPSAGGAKSASAAAAPELPRFQVDTNEVPPSGRTHAVRAGGDFQAALDKAQPGDVITLEAGAMFTGPFTLPKKSASGWIIIRTSASNDRLPAGKRVSPSSANVMPKLVADHDFVLRAAPGAHHYRFIGVELKPKDGAYLYNLVLLGSDEKSVEELPHHIIFDRCYLHGDPKKGTRRGIALNSAHTAIVDSYLADFKEAGEDSQAIMGWNGPGPFKIVNNYLEGAGENLLFGGADPAIKELVPSDIEIRGNHFDKPLSWKAGSSNYAGTPWAVKNLLELKNARRVLIEENLFGHNWEHAQNGFAILFTVRNQDGGAPWVAVEDVTFRFNVVRHTGSGMNIMGRDNNAPSRQTRRIWIQNNLFEDVSGAKWGGNGTLFQVFDGTADVVIEHNTGFQDGNLLFATEAPNTGFIFRNNIAPHNQYGVIGTGTGPGIATIEKYFPAALFKKNAIAGGDGSRYPRDNFFPASLDQVGFANLAAGNYRLGDSSQMKKAGTDGKDLGVDFDALSRAMSDGSRDVLSARSSAPAGKKP